MKTVGRTRPVASGPVRWEICILAGGLSTRMGRDKSRLRLGARTLLGHVRAAAQALGVPVRVVRRDAVPRCGPLGGVLTALRRTRADAVLFLACDMPWISPALLRALMRRAASSGGAVFVRSGGAAGFPFVLPRGVRLEVAEQIVQRAFSLQALAQRLRARVWTPPARWRAQLRNLNTPEDWERARRQWPAARGKTSRPARRVACQRRAAPLR